MSTEDRILRLENAMSTLAEMAADQQRRTSRLEESFTVLIDLVRRHDDRMDEFREGLKELRAAQAESERKIGALADAQAHTDKKLDALIDIVRDQRNGQS